MTLYNTGPLSDVAQEGSGNGTMTIPEFASPSATITASSLILLVLLGLIPPWLYLSYRNSTTRSVLFYGWIPVIAAMCISRLVHGARCISRLLHGTRGVYPG